MRIAPRQRQSMGRNIKTIARACVSNMNVLIPFKSTLKNAQQPCKFRANKLKTQAAIQVSQTKFILKPS
jgi:predicted NAD-dependent protein-ADP-ribosyltransferase YbiA (DUF1768 family)